MMDKNTKCKMCGKTYDEHAGQYGPYDPVPRVPCTGLRRHFIAAQEDFTSRSEMIKILEGLRDINLQTSGTSFDYKKGMNDAHWEYYKQINIIIESLKK